MAEQDWRNGLCGHVCGGSYGDCMGSWFCTPCLFGRVGSRNEKFPDSRKESIDTCNADCGLMCLAGCCYLHWLPLMIKRSDVRKKFNIGGNGCTDCLVAACCTPCAVAQLSTELKDRSEAAALMGPKGAYASSHDGMVYKAPR